MSLLDDIRAYWDEDAPTYDRAATHQPTSPAERAAWDALLRRLLPPPPARVLDCGAGTGFLSLLAAAQGHRVTALDLSPAMLERLGAKAGASKLAVATVEGSATEPPPGPFDVVVERHLLWTLPDPTRALRAWRAVAPEGRLVVVEGLWGSADRLELLRATGRQLVHRLRCAGAALGLVPAPGSEHHAEYDPAVRASLPFGAGTPPGSLVQAVLDAGWRDPGIERLRDVEWAANLALGFPERLFGVHPRFVVTAW